MRSINILFVFAGLFLLTTGFSPSPNRVQGVQLNLRVEYEGEAYPANKTSYYLLSLSVLDADGKSFDRVTGYYKAGGTHSTLKEMSFEMELVNGLWEVPIEMPYDGDIALELYLNHPGGKVTKKVAWKNENIETFWTKNF